ncbi:hypothetical protein LWI29_009672 [Acer saccharum]|uniref:F-box domain-containing protein n=1 Tax=Acer saccharum TaxID=4024 RepID=A0AA39RKT2_ACESA|nr:hypothetical protein LWI29_009672 [Acer saccharum]
MDQWNDGNYVILRNLYAMEERWRDAENIKDCIAAVISFTTPRDACRLACVSTTFRSATDSDGVWDRFLPHEYSSSSSSSSSTTWLTLWKKELYFCTCHSFIHNGEMWSENLVRQRLVLLELDELLLVMVQLQWTESLMRLKLVVLEPDEIQLVVMEGDQRTEANLVWAQLGMKPANMNLETRL